ncbi:MAG: exopolysaccharide glucosyl ketal-pyruvate-transferase [Rhodospirillales bacterium]|jgi:succinoglycan biosynthesis protein ExoV|nr:exopolysaccharide glucosyl ketal-pyruvate-transferase [Rhodospirillales bacterium]
MKLYYFRRKPNFGDTLNPFLWDKLLPNAFDDDGSELFLGIGSILYDGFPQEVTKIVFGSGYGGYTSRPQLDEKWYVHFVRGPRTAQALGIDRKLGIGDPAILIRTIGLKKPEKRHPISVLLHHESVELGLWHKVAEQANIRLIDVRRPVLDVLDEIASSEMVLCEAMHAAIVADALRVPWVPLLPVNPRHRFKWHDWAESLELALRPVPLYPSSILELFASRIRPRNPWLRKAGYQLSSRLSRVLRPQGPKSPSTKPAPDQPIRAEREEMLIERWFGKHFVDRAAQSLEVAARQSPSLSQDAVIDRATDQMLARLDWLKRHGARSVMPG